MGYGLWESIAACPSNSGENQEKGDEAADDKGTHSLAPSTQSAMTLLSLRKARRANSVRKKMKEEDEEDMEMKYNERNVAYADFKADNKGSKRGNISPC